MELNPTTQTILTAGQAQKALFDHLCTSGTLAADSKDLSHHPFPQITYSGKWNINRLLDDCDDEDDDQLSIPDLDRLTSLEAQFIEDQADAISQSYLQATETFPLGEAIGEYPKTHIRTIGQLTEFILNHECIGEQNKNILLRSLQKAEGRHLLLCLCGKIEGNSLCGMLTLLAVISKNHHRLCQISIKGSFQNFIKTYEEIEHIVKKNLHGCCSFNKRQVYLTELVSKCTLIAFGELVEK